MRTPTTAQVRTAIEVLKKVEERIDNHATFNLMQLPEARDRDEAAARIEAQTIEQIARVKTVMAQLESWRDELRQERSNMLHSMFKTGQALLLSSLRFLRPRNSRGESANQSGNMNCSRPLTRRIREHEQAQNRSQSRPIHVHEQSASAFSPRQQSGGIRDQGTVSTGCCLTLAADATSPQRSQGFAQPTSEASTQTDFGRDSEQATNRPCFRIAVAIAPPTSFPVHIRIISTNVLI